MENSKVFAYQVAPEYKESPLSNCGCRCDESYLDSLAIVGNDDYKPMYGSNTESIKCAVNVLENFDLGGLIDKEARYADSGREPLFYADEKNLFDDVFYIEDRGGYTTNEIEKIRDILTAYDLSDIKFTDAVCALANIIDGLEPEKPDDSQWRYTEIRGDSQRDWQGVFYLSEYWDEKMIEDIGTEYFNTGDEWMCKWDGDPDNYKISVYTHNFADDEIKKEIADAMDCSPDDVQLYVFKGWKREAQYEIA